MSDPQSTLALLVRQLRSQSPLSDDDVAAIMALSGTLRVLEPSAYIVREGEPPKFCAFLLAGYAYRQKITRDGLRQIVSLHVPGDALDFQNLYLASSDHNVQALTRVEILTIPRTEFQALIEHSPAISHAVIVNVLIEAAISREWLLNIGRRDARSRLAHLLCEFAVRLDSQGLGTVGEYDLPMTQEQLGDALGLTSVHINRTLKALQAEGVLSRQGRLIRFTDWDTMRRVADFSALYLHLDERRPVAA